MGRAEKARDLASGSHAARLPEPAPTPAAVDPTARAPVAQPEVGHFCDNPRVVRAEFVLSDLHDRYDVEAVDLALQRLYIDEDARLVPMFASLHQRLNSLFEFLNEKKRINGHYNADESRQLLDTMVEIDRVRSDLRRIGLNFSLARPYEATLDSCKEFLSRSGGSTIPEGFGPILVERYEPIFCSSHIAVRSGKDERSYQLQLVGEGSYAVVHKYFDEEYGEFFAVKRARGDLAEKELARFRAEYKLLKQLRFPYIVKAYKYNESNDSYIMEYCDATLDRWVKENNARLSMSTRKRVALQFLYGVNYLQLKDVLHRDISRTNILVKEYDYSAVIVKLSDFGLHKDPRAARTATGSSMKGTIVDPTLERFMDYDLPAEVYAIGFVLSFIFSGRESLGACAGPPGLIVERCTSPRRFERYPSIANIIADVETLPTIGSFTSA